MYRLILKFGLLAAAMIFLVQLSKYSIYSHDWQQEWIIGIAALGFIGLGIFISRQWFSKQEENPISTGSIEKVDFEDKGKVDFGEKIEALGISKREYEVLNEIAKGKSNQEIGDSLFISENTVKTHVSNLLIKLEAKRRTQAVSKAKEIGLLK